jgi:hypothetical protein
VKRMLGPLAAALLLAGLLPASVLAATVPKFTVQPAGATAGAAWGQQPQVSILTDNVVDTTATGTVTLSRKPGTGPAAAVLSCAALTVPLVNGVATFSGCSIDLAGSGYRLTATWSGGGAVDSATFVVAGPGGATKLAFVVQPARGTPGGALAVQPSVALQAGGVNQTGAPPTGVTLAIGMNPGGAILTCAGGLTTMTQNGVAAFSGCALDKVGVGYTLVATAAGLTSAPSAAFDVADRLGFAAQPAGATGGKAFATQPIVVVRAGPSLTATHDKATSVTLSIKPGTGAPGATLTCPGGLSKTVAGGIAKFAGCAIDKASPTSPANPYVLVATAGGLVAAESAPFAVTVGPATRLVFVAQPGQSVGAQPFPVQPVVAITDAGGNIVTTGPSSTKTVRLAIDANPGGGALTCAGGLDKVAVAGIATFAGCAINKGGVGYTLVATSSGLTKATSSPFNVVANASITLTNSARVITWGGSVLLIVQFGANGANKTFNLEGARDGVSWTTRATLTTNAAGQATFTYRPATNLYYRAVFAGTPDLTASTSNTTRTVVRQIALLRPTNFGAIKSIPPNRSITFTTTARPARAELPPVRVSFVFYRRVGSVWTFVTKRDVFINSLGKASTTFRFTRAGSWYVRSIANPTPFNANSVWSPLERYTVR